MRRRSKIEVEIRNILSEVLILSLKASEKSALLYLISKFCQLKEKKGRKRIKIVDLLEYQEVIDWLQPAWKEVLNELSSFSIFKTDSEDYIQIKSRFERHLSGICNKSRLYWDFISSLYSKKKSFKVGIEGEIKKGVLLFNEGFYFECHEFLEEIWRKEKGREKEFLKGLIHAAVAFYHLEYENYKGTINYLRRSYKRLKDYEPVFVGVDIKTFLTDVESYIKHLEKPGTYNLEILKSTIPRIKLIE